MKILVTGGTGVVGSSFLSLFKKRRNNVYAPTREKLDINNKEDIKNNIVSFKPDVIIHFAAFRDAGKAEKERGNKKGIVWQTNVVATKNILKYAKQINAYVIYISTDMVFPGLNDEKGPYKEYSHVADTLRKVSWYGWTKINAESYVKNYNKSAIIRIGNVTMDTLLPRFDYLGKILSLYDEKKLYPIFDDQYITLTYIPTLVNMIEKFILSPQKGIYHIASTNIFTPVKLANYLLKRAREVENVVKVASLADYLKKYPKRYPQYGGLDVKKTQKKYMLRLETWEQIVDRFVKNTRV